MKTAECVPLRPRRAEPRIHASDLAALQARHRPGEGECPPRRRARPGRSAERDAAAAAAAPRQRHVRSAQAPARWQRVRSARHLPLFTSAADWRASLAALQVRLARIEQFGSPSDRAGALHPPPRHRSAVAAPASPTRQQRAAEPVRGTRDGRWCRKPPVRRLLRAHTCVLSSRALTLAPSLPSSRASCRQFAYQPPPDRSRASTPRRGPSAVPPHKGYDRVDFSAPPSFFEPSPFRVAPNKPPPPLATPRSERIHSSRPQMAPPSRAGTSHAVRESASFRHAVQPMPVQQQQQRPSTSRTVFSNNPEAMQQPLPRGGADRPRPLLRRARPYSDAFVRFSLPQPLSHCALSKGRHSRRCSPHGTTTPPTCPRYRRRRQIAFRSTRRPRQDEEWCRRTSQSTTTRAAAARCTAGGTRAARRRGRGRGSGRRSTRPAEGEEQLAGVRRSRSRSRSEMVMTIVTRPWSSL